MTAGEDAAKRRHGLEMTATANTGLRISPRIAYLNTGAK